MRRSSPSRPLLPADWMEALGRLQQALEQAEAAAAQRAAALNRPAEPSAPDDEPLWRRGVRQAGERLDGLSVHANRATHKVAAVDAALGTGEDAFRDWLATCEAARQKLAEWVGRAVG